MRKFVAVFSVFLLLAGNIMAAEMPVQAAPRVQPVDEVVTIVIDPGHGGKNEGTKENGVLEKAMTLVTAQAMYDELCKYDNVNVYLTRTADVNMDLKERAQFADSVDADFLFSIHYNASLSHELFGSEVWVSAFPPYNAYGYQFGCVQMQTMQDLGLFLRGVKTRIGDDGLDYYGIIRESRELEIPAVIIEHCHVDEGRDIPFCDSEEDLKAFGRADALSVAKYFGLSSTELGVDYSSYSSRDLAEASASARVQMTEADLTEPDVCRLELLDVDYDAGEVTLEVSAADYDSMLAYYSYSLDGGESYTSRQPWPGSNALTGNYMDIFTVTLQVLAGEGQEVVFRAYNPYDLYTESNSVGLSGAISQGAGQAVAVGGSAVIGVPGDASDAEKPGAGVSGAGNGGAIGNIGAEGSSLPDATAGMTQGSNLPGTTTFRPDEPEVEEDSQVSFFTFLLVCLVIVVVLLSIVILSQVISDWKRKRRRQRRKLEGDRSHQHR